LMKCSCGNTRSSDITSPAPTSSDRPTSSPLPQLPAPSRRAVSSAGSTSENALAASMIPAPNPSRASCTRRLNDLANNTGKVPTMVAPAAIEPARNAACTVLPSAIGGLQVVALAAELDLHVVGHLRGQAQRGFQLRRVDAVGQLDHEEQQV